MHKPAPESYEELIRLRKKRWTESFIVFYVLCVMLIAAFLTIPTPWNLVTFYLLAIPVAVWLSLRLWRIPCPRCGKSFTANWRTGSQNLLFTRCQSCGVLLEELRHEERH